LRAFLQSPAFLVFAGGILGALITYVVAPWAKDRVEAGKEKRAFRRGQIERARSDVQIAFKNAAKKSEPFEAHIQKTRGFLDIEHSLPESTRERIRKSQTQRTIVVQPDGPTGIQGIARELLDEISKLEKEWGLK